MHGTKNVAVDNESAWDGGLKLYRDCLTGRQSDPSIKVGLYCEAVRLCLVLITHQKPNHIAQMHVDYRPRIQGCSVSNAVVKARQVSDYEEEPRRTHTGRLSDAHWGSITLRATGRRDLD